MVGLVRSTRYVLALASPAPPAPLPRSGFVLRPTFCHSHRMREMGRFHQIIQIPGTLFCNLIRCGVFEPRITSMTENGVACCFPLRSMNRRRPLSR